jgi:hypothetical protein
MAAVDRRLAHLTPEEAANEPPDHEPRAMAPGSAAGGEPTAAARLADLLRADQRVVVRVSA